MALTYREKMNITEKFLGEMRHRLSDKDTSVLPPGGEVLLPHKPSRAVHRGQSRGHA